MRLMYPVSRCEDTMNPVQPHIIFRNAHIVP